MTKLLLAHDLGTSSIKSTLYSFEGRALDVSIQAYPTYYKQNNIFVEQDPDLWWQAFCLNNKHLLRKRKPSDVQAVAISGQMMACLPVDSSGEPLRHCIIWADQRADKEAKLLEELIGNKKFYSITGNRISANYTAPKILYLKNNEPLVFDKAHKYIQPKDFITYRLTGRFTTDTTDAGHTHLYDIFNDEWSKTILSLVGITEEKLPEIVNSGTKLGYVSPHISEECGLDPSTIVVQGAGDGRAAMLGAGVIEHGDSYISLGSSSWFSAVTDNKRIDPDRGLYKGISLRKPFYINGGTMQAGGLNYDWFLNHICDSQTDTCGTKTAFDYFEDKISCTDPGSKGLIYMPYLLGERAPWFNSQLSAAFLGLKAHHNRFDMGRSVLEGVALHLSILYNRAKKLDHIKNVFVVGGGAASGVWRQILADVFQMNMIKINVDIDVGALGTAVLAGVGSGIYRDVSVVKDFITVESITEPNPTLADIYSEMRFILEAAYHSLYDVNRRISKLQTSIYRYKESR